MTLMSYTSENAVFQTQILMCCLISMAPHTHQQLQKSQGNFLHTKECLLSNQRYLAFFLLSSQRGVILTWRYQIQSFLFLFFTRIHLTHTFPERTFFLSGNLKKKKKQHMVGSNSDRPVFYFFHGNCTCLIPLQLRCLTSVKCCTLVFPLREVIMEKSNYYSKC